MSERRILLVDSTAADRELAAFVLTRAADGLVVDEAADAAAFTEKLSKGAFAAVVTAHRLGWSDGPRVVAAAKRLYPHRPVVLFAVEPPLDELAEAFHQGLDRFVAKTSAGYLELPAVVIAVLEEALRRGGDEPPDPKLIDRLPVGVFTASSDGGIVRANRELARLLGRTSPSELAGEELGAYLADREARERWRDLVRHGGVEIRNLEVRLRRPRGELAWARLTAWPVAGEGEEALRGLCEGTLEDIGDSRRSQEEITRRADALDRSNRELAEFAHVVSHDLQAPLGLVARYAKLLGERFAKELGTDGGASLRRVIDNAERMQAMIDDILEYSRAGSVDRTFQSVDLDQVIDEVVATLASEAEQSRAEITRDELPTVYADRAQMVQLFQNLIGNALKFRGKPPPAVHLAAQEEGEMWSVSVRDNGIGIDPEHHERIFKMFQRAHSDSEYPGTGVGLALCKRIVERHGGAIWVDSDLGDGATFHVRLPQPPPAAHRAGGLQETS